MEPSNGRRHSRGGVVRISHHQLLCLAFTLHFPAAELVLPGSLAQLGRSGGWIAPLLAFVVSALPVSTMVGLIVRRHPGQRLGEMAACLLGPFWGRASALVLALFSLVLTGLTLRDVVEIIPVAILPATPMWAVAVPFMLVAAYGSYTGAEALVRLSVFFIAATGGVALLALLTLIGLIHPFRLLPLYDQGPGQLLAASWPSIGWFAEGWSFLTFAALVDKGEKAGRGLVLGAALAALYLTALTALSIAVFGYELASHFTFALYSLVQQIAIGEFVERLDVFMISIWLVGMIIKASAHLWVAADSAAFTLGVKNERYLLPFLGAGALGLTGLIPNLPWLVTFSTTTWTPISLGLGFGIPGLLLIASWIRAYREPGRRGMGPGSLQGNL